MGRRLAALASLVRSGTTRERLPPPPPEDPAPPPRPSTFARLFRPEPLPRDPERPRRPRRGWLAFLFAPERLDGPGAAGPEVH